MNQWSRWADEPWVHDSGVTWPWNSAWMRSSPTAAAAKAGGLYRNTAWDLVDRMDEPGFDLAKVPESELPEAMRSMTPDARKAHLLEKKAERARVAARIQQLDAERRAYVAEEMGKQKLDDGKALDRALRDAIREQAAASGFTFEPAK